jgi:hypothetical protein
MNPTEHFWIGQLSATSLGCISLMHAGIPPRCKGPIPNLIGPEPQEWDRFPLLLGMPKPGL